MRSAENDEGDSGDLFDDGMFRAQLSASRRARPSGFPLSASEMRKHTSHEIPDTPEDSNGDAHLRWERSATSRALAAAPRAAPRDVADSVDAHVRYQLPRGNPAGLAPRGPMVRGRTWNDSN